jgi:hypothetical protein
MLGCDLKNRPKVGWAGWDSFSARIPILRSEGGYCAYTLGHSIFTEAGALEELRADVLEAKSVRVEDAPMYSRQVRSIIKGTS